MYIRTGLASVCELFELARKLILSIDTVEPLECGDCGGNWKSNPAEDEGTRGDAVIKAVWTRGELVKIKGVRCAGLRVASELGVMTPLGRGGRGVAKGLKLGTLGAGVEERSLYPRPFLRDMQQNMRRKMLWICARDCAVVPKTRRKR